ncbi:leucine efflux protein LeuE [Polynucleobacter sp. JS-Safj-400b-B2]|uniref:leucine efflux protein LeuE n=1 Tax=Polynucleobacter sp. JS-Safj-400b-B2 TaxID=2576921 RepID=UPI001C0A96A3|nr:leucine efflux protein LeuE [Polynucleobacter sp. JS-Safj-400b-B2]MBU3626116.1 leucine efflux protein LeuE [Polynucleobacter sp. JS-Safj-400b-B2]
MEWLSLSLLSPANAGIVDFSSYLLGTLFVILLPGPNSLYVLTIALAKGWRSGAWGALGIFIGDSLLMIAVALGAASLLMSSPMVFSFVRTLGAMYFAWMGFGLLRSGQQRWTKQDTKTREVQMRLMQLHPLFAALTLSLTNPKAIFFFIAFFSQFIRPDVENPTYTFLYLAIVLQVMSMAYLASLIFVGQIFLKFFQRQPRVAAGLWMFAGMLFIGFAIRLLIA